MNPNPYLRGGITPSTSLSSGAAHKAARRRAPRNPDDATYRPPPRTASSEEDEDEDEDDDDAYYEYGYGHAPPATPEPNTPRRGGAGSGAGGRRRRRLRADGGDAAYRPEGGSGGSEDEDEDEEEGRLSGRAARRRRGVAGGGSGGGKARLRVKGKSVSRPSAAAAGPAAGFGVTPPATPRPAAAAAAPSPAAPAAVYGEEEEEEESSDEDGYDDEEGGYEPEPRPDLAPLFEGPNSWLSWPSWDFVGGESRDLAGLAADGWCPARTRFDHPWRKAEYETEWYEAVYWNLFVRVREFVEEYFGCGDIPGVPIVPPVGGGGGGEERGFPWLEGGFSKEFMWFVEKVAIQDNNAGGWDALLRRGVMRECLVTGIIAKLLETSVFDELLFGADQTQKTMLESQDECTLQYEGYQRTTLRAQCIRTLLIGETLTAEFWPCVDRLAFQTTSLLLPLLRLMDRHFPDSRTKSLRNMYQDLHVIIAEAGYLSIGIRWSGNIFRITSPFPGEVWDLGQEHIEPELYEMSEATNQRADRIAETMWREKRRQQYRQQQEREAQPGAPTLREQAAVISSVLSPLKDVWKRVTGQETEEDSGDEKDNNDEWHSASRMGKVQVIAWPMLQRFQTVGELDPDTGAADGETITTVVKSQVVYYFGRIDNNGDQSDDVPTLSDWVQQNKRDRRRKLLLPLRWVAYAAGVWLLLSFLALYISAVNDILQAVNHGLGTVVKYIVREVVLFVLEILITVVACAIGFFKVWMYLAYVVGDLLSRPSLFGLRLAGRGFGDIWGMQGWVNGVGGQRQSGVEYPNLGWGSLKAMARAVTGDVIWRPVTVQVPVGYTHP